METRDVALEIRDVVKTFRRDGKPFNAVDHTTWQVQTGEVVAFLGENGAGKSTTLDMVLGLTIPTDGVIQVMGMSPRQAIRGGHIGAVLQQSTLPQSATVTEVLGMVAATYGQQCADIPELLESWDLIECARSKVSRCSGGQIQRLRSAIAVMHDPDLLILDEPTTGMDVGARSRFWRRMHAQAESGRTIVFATHYLAEAEEFADRIVLISRGKIVADDSTSQLRERMGHATVTAELTDTEMIQELANYLKQHDLGELHVEGVRVVITTANSDNVARHLLMNTAARHLTVSQARLEEIFTELTEQPPCEEMAGSSHSDEGVAR